MSDFSTRLIRIIPVFVLIFFLMLVFESELSGQCPMCKISAESNMRDGGSAGRGLNAGILYMFALPYIIIGTLGFLWFKNRKQYDNEP